MMTMTAITQRETIAARSRRSRSKASRSGLRPSIRAGSMATDGSKSYSGWPVASASSRL